MLEPTVRELSAWLRDERERWHVPGIVVGLRSGSDTVTAAEGVLELGREEPVGPDTIFRIASITKPFVATLALTFVEDGALSLDEPISPRVDATLRQLLSHQGGLESEWPSSLNDYGESDDALVRLLEGEPARLPVGPGELFSYCNTGFWYVGAAAARLNGTTFEEAMRSRVVEALGLRQTSFDPPPGAACGHNQVEPGADEHEPARDAYPRVRRPSGGLWSSVEDLLRFADHQLGGPGPLSRESIAEMQRGQVECPGGAYGLGWSMRTTGGRRIVEHGGSVAGYQSLLLLAPDENFAIAALTNSSRGSVAIRGILERLGLDAEEPPDFPLSAEALRAFEGRYRGQDIQLDVAIEDSRLRIQYSEGDPLQKKELAFPAFHARPIGEHDFAIVDGEWRGDRVEFPRAGLASIGVILARVDA